MRRALLPGFVAASIACLAASCSGTDVTLATLPSGDDAAPPPSPLRCASIVDCPGGSYCDKAACGDPSGTCVLFPVECPDEEMPVCGCDGLTYFDHCLRQLASVESESPGPCPGFTCGGSLPSCPAETYCSQFAGMGPGRCSTMVEGNCWVLPSQCPPPAQGANLWDACLQPGPHCLDTCEALRMGGTFQHAFMCP